MERYNLLREGYERVAAAQDEAISIIREHIHEMSITREETNARLDNARDRAAEEYRRLKQQRAEARQQRQNAASRD
jgi:prefoldin subunit 5